MILDLETLDSPVQLSRALLDPICDALVSERLFESTTDPVSVRFGLYSFDSEANFGEIPVQTW